MVYDHEERRLRSIALQNANAILLASQRAEPELAAELDRLQITFASAGDAVISTDSRGRVTYLNGMAEVLTGWTQAEAAGRPLSEVFHLANEEASQPGETPAARGLREGGLPGLSNFTVLIARDGTRRRIDDSVAPVLDESGAPVGVVVVFHDTTERQRAEEAQARLAAIVESSDDAIISKGLDGIVRTWNTGAERLFGHRAEEAIGQSITLIIPPERLDEEREILARLARGERIEHFETVRMAKDGRRIDTSLTVSPVRDSEGRIIGASKIARDVTERRQAEEALREADRRKDDFLALLAHELRNPLAPLRNGLHVMRLASNDAERVARLRDMMERQLSHMVRLIDDLLDVARISRNKMELRRSRVLLADVVHSAVETARPTIEAAGHVLTVALPPAPVHLDADLTRLAQVFGNLLNNSSKYTERGGQIWLTARRDGDRIAVEVRDTGIGIPAHALPKIFDMFSQVDRSIERSTGGLGIGLALVKGLVEMHGGTVEAVSPGQGQGSTFTVRLPVLADHATSATLAGTWPEAAGARRRILVVDDNLDSATSMAMMLQLLGNDVRTAHDGLAAMEQAETFRPQVILMDLGMPRLNGFEATRRIREQPWGREVVIIALTGWGQEGDRARSKEAGCDGHLVKPVDLEHLEKLLLELEGRSAPAGKGG
jgi:PAS domain S-box-containing protein